MQGFCDAVDKENIINAFNSGLTLDPNVNNNILENMLTKLYEQHFSLNTVRYNKYEKKRKMGQLQGFYTLSNIETNCTVN